MFRSSYVGPLFAVLIGMFHLFTIRGGHAWGDDFTPMNRRMANTWHGEFPWNYSPGPRANERPGTTPVCMFPPNGYGLYDMAGNVWQWCSDWYLPEAYALRAAKGVVVNPTGPDQSFDPRQRPPERVHRGGSFLCCDGYCFNYRPSARMGCTPDTGLSHVGFRCVMTASMKDKPRRCARLADLGMPQESPRSRGRACQHARRVRYPE